MNTYKKYCPNVFVAQCEEKQEKGSIITIVTKYAKKRLNDLKKKYDLAVRLWGSNN